MQTSIRSTTDSTQHCDLPRTENDGGNSWKRLCSSLGLARDDDDDDVGKVVTICSWSDGEVCLVCIVYCVMRG